MFTRSQEVVIDFDGASKAWKANKKRTGNGCYVYVCGTQLKNGKLCQNPQTCHLHRQITQSSKIR